MSYCDKHGVRWTGHTAQHCCACGEVFSGETAGNMHRVGDHAVFTGPTRRRCLSRLEMLEKGMEPRVNASGTEIWTTGARLETPFYVSRDDPGLRSRRPEGEGPGTRLAATEMEAS